MIASIDIMPRRPALFRGQYTSTNVPSRPRRSLFRTQADIPESLEFVRRELAEISNRSRERWNFDFVTGLPIEGGRYEWQSFAAESSSSTSTQSAERPRDSAVETATEPASVDAVPSVSNLKQKKISDFLLVRKRHSSSPSRKATSPLDEFAPAAAKVQRTASS